MDIIAWLILGSFYIFGGAFFFFSCAEDRTEYNNVLLGWTLLNLFVVVAAVAVFAVFWAFGTLIA